MESPSRRSPRTRSQLGGRRCSSRPPTHLHSDCPPEPPDDDPADSPSLGKRSVSLTTLQPAQPRMAQLETLEAKMASIEVSLSSTPRRKKNGFGVFSLGSSIRSVPKEMASKELEALRNALRDKENIIQTLKGQLTVPASLHLKNNTSNRELSEIEKKQAEDRLLKLKVDIDNKRLAIKNLKMVLDRLDITDNIDVRIQQAELEYQLGREELNLLTLLEETRALQLCLEESNKSFSALDTLYSCLKNSENVAFIAADVVYDPKSPKFVTGNKDSLPGLWIHWALEDTQLKKGDRLLEVNGKIVLTKSREDLTRLLSAAPNPAQIVVLRQQQQVDSGCSSGSSSTSSTNGSNTIEEVSALRNELEVVKERADEAQRAKDGLRADNVRLTHRISYLEEQVSELLGRKQESSRNDNQVQKQVNPSAATTKTNVTSISITSKPTVNVTTSNDVQVFQKGPQVTALVAKLPGFEQTSKEQHYSHQKCYNVSTTHIPTPNNEANQSSRNKHRNKSESNGRYCEHFDTSYKKYSYKEYDSETNSTVDSSNKNGFSKHGKTHSERSYNSNGSLLDQNYKKATKIVQDLTKHKDNTLYEKHRQKCISASEKYNTDLLKHYNVRKSSSVMDFQSEVHNKPNKYTSESKSVEELDKKINLKSLDYTSEPDNKNGLKTRPTPPKKPLRLSLHKAQSLQSVDDGKEVRKSLKRTYKGEVTLRMMDGHQQQESLFFRNGRSGTLQWANLAQVK